MGYEITNKVKGRSTIRAVNPGTYTIALSDLRANTNIETILSAAITDIEWSTSGYISITRGSEPVFNLFTTGSWVNQHTVRQAGANSADQNIVITINSGGSVVLDLTKNATYNVDLGRVILNT